MIDKGVIANPKTKYGHGHKGTREFVVQRITGALNVLFTLFFAWFVVSLAGADRAQMVDVVRNPFVAIVLVALIVNVCVHMRIGMHEVIEDYIDDEAQNRVLNTLNTLFAILVAALTIVAVAKIAFWG